MPIDRQRLDMVSTEFDVRMSLRQRVTFTGFVQKCWHLDNKKVIAQFTSSNFCRESNAYQRLFDQKEIVYLALPHKLISTM